MEVQKDITTTFTIRIKKSKIAQLTLLAESIGVSRNALIKKTIDLGLGFYGEDPEILDKAMDGLFALTKPEDPDQLYLWEKQRQKQRAIRADAVLDAQAKIEDFTKNAKSYT